MPKDNEVDEKVTKGVVATVCLVPHLSDHLAGVEMQLFGSYEPRIGDEFYSAATVAELRAEVERLRKSNELYSFAMNTAGIDELKRRADAAERRVGELEAALQAYQSAEAMSNYGDYSDFVFPKRSMRKEGEPACGWICEKHGLGYWGGCVCCADDFKDHQNRKDREASYARNEALSAARQLAATALTGADPT